MAKDVAAGDSDELDDGAFDDSDDSGYDSDVVTGGADSSIRRKIEERLERKRLMEELDLLDDFDI